MLDLEKIKEKAKWGGHYSDILNVWVLINEVETLRKKVEELENENHDNPNFGCYHDCCE